ncbi:MAG: PhoH family protein [Verrucomicrobiota bacterium]
MASSETLTFENARIAQALYLNDPQTLQRVETAFEVKITSRDAWLKIEGSKDGIQKASLVFNQLHEAHKKGSPIRKHEFNFALQSAEKATGVSLTDLHSKRIDFSAKKGFILPKTLHQKEYIEAIQKNDLVFGVGPAGTGKTYLAMAVAVAALKAEKITKIVLTRPAVEAGEALGFLPGDFKEKIAPYLRPLYDALDRMLEPEEIQRYMEKSVIEIAPLAYMRGRTLSNSFIILDESQNTTTEQMFMFLTRLGQDSKCVVTGDPTQIDLPHSRKSGLIEAVQALSETEGVVFCKFDEMDVVRHELVQRIITSYRAHRGGKMTSLTL